ncbi:MAG TPA: DUF2207 domain-containing protein [bacterium]|nr:DUF2207 domain-containing protein [bacterium]
MRTNFWKKFFRGGALTFLLVSVFLFLPQAGQADETSEWQITDYQVLIKPIANDYKIKVTEKINGDFYTLHHGIYRYMPVFMKDTAFTQARLLVNDVKVTIDSGFSHPYTYSDNGQIYLKIGDPDATFSGPRLYNIDYTIVNGGWRYFEDKQEAEIYWNAVGTDWPVNIEKVSVIYDFSEWANFNLAEAPSACYTGVHGATGTDCTLRVDGQKLLVESTRLLTPGEGLTVAVAVPLHLVPRPSTWEAMIFWIKGNGLAFIPYLWLLAMIYVWFKWGKDKKDERSLVVEYTAVDQLPPATMYQVLKQRNNKDYLTAEIIYLATRKHIKIEKTEKTGFFGGKSDDYAIVLLNKNYLTDQSLAGYQVMILDLLFHHNPERFVLSEVKNVMRATPTYYQKQFSAIQKEINREIKDGQYFVLTPNVSLFITIGFLATLWFSMAFASVMNEYLIPLYLINLMIVSVLVFLIGFFGMAKYTDKGLDARWKLRGLEMYLKTAEAERFKFGELTDLFEKLLPYAIAIGLLKKWLKIMGEIYKTPPEWYNDKDFATMGMAGLAGSLNDMGNSISRAMSDARSSGSSGGGSSGGGGGGGGGGGW